MSESEEDFTFDYTNSSFNRNITDLMDYNFSLSTSINVNQSELNHTVGGQKSRKITTSGNSEDSASFSSLSSATSTSPELLNQIKTLDGASDSTVAEYKALLEQVNRAHVEYKISEFMVGCVKESSSRMPPQVRAKVQRVCAKSAAHELIKLRSGTGESFDILGVTDEQGKHLEEPELSPLEKIKCNKHISETVKRKVKELKKQKQILVGSFPACEQEREPADVDTILTGARKKQQQLLKVLTSQVEAGLDLLNDIKGTVLQIAHWKDESSSKIPELSNSLCEKATFLSTFTRKLRLQVDAKSYGDHKYNRALNDYGNLIKALIEDRSYELNKLESSLAEYEKKRQNSQKYKTIVEEFARVKQQLQHSLATLSMMGTDSPVLVRSSSVGLRGSNKP